MSSNISERNAKDTRHQSRWEAPTSKHMAEHCATAATAAANPNYADIGRRKYFVETTMQVAQQAQILGKGIIISDSSSECHSPICKDKENVKNDLPERLEKLEQTVKQQKVEIEQQKAQTEQQKAELEQQKAHTKQLQIFFAGQRKSFAQLVIRSFTVSMERTACRYILERDRDLKPDRSKGQKPSYDWSKAKKLSFEKLVKLVSQEQVSQNAADDAKQLLASWWSTSSSTTSNSLADFFELRTNGNTAAHPPVPEVTEAVFKKIAKLACIESLEQAMHLYEAFQRMKNDMSVLGKTGLIDKTGALSDAGLGDLACSDDDAS